jgi:tetratricopeptide (TPR) repeat protein
MARAFLLMALFTRVLFGVSDPAMCRPHFHWAYLIDNYFDNFKQLKEEAKWDEIILQGTRALDAARRLGRPVDEAKIAAQLTSTSFYQGDYESALKYANCCHELSEHFEDKRLFIRALYLESAVHRALAGKGQSSYSRAVAIAEEALDVYAQSGLDDPALLGKVYFNLGAALADNPEGDLSLAQKTYSKAINFFQQANAEEDVVRSMIRLGRVYLLQGKYGLLQCLIQELRSKALGPRSEMQLDYLEAQGKKALGEMAEAVEIAQRGLAIAERLGANEDIIRFIALLK